MKKDQILVGLNGAVMTLTSGKSAMAVYPAKKGQKTSYLLLTDGGMATMAGSRVNGLSIERYFSEHGFGPATPNDAAAALLADIVNAREGTALIEKHNMEFANQLARELAGQECTFVPFDTAKPIGPVTIEMPRGSICVAFDLVNGFASGTVPIVYRPDARSYGSGVQLSEGWLVAPEGSPDSMPRNTEYGGVVEHAVFVICNSGLGTLVGAKNLKLNVSAARDEPCPRGKLVVKLKNGDLLTVGVDAVDELVVRYTRGDEVLYVRERALGSQSTALRLGSVIGSIAAALVHVQELDAVPVKALRARAKKPVQD